MKVATIPVLLYVCTISFYTQINRFYYELIYYITHLAWKQIRITPLVLFEMQHRFRLSEALVRQKLKLENIILFATGSTKIVIGQKRNEEWQADGVATLLKGLKLYRKLVVDHLTESIHVVGRHYTSKDKLWNALADTFNDLSMDTTKKFTSSADNRLSFVAQNKDRYTNHLC